MNDIPERNALDTLGEETLSQSDRQAIAERGIALSDVQFQLRHLRQPGVTVWLDRPATFGDGVAALPPAGDRTLFDKAISLGRVSAFVPASGDATRMFESLYKILEAGEVDEATLRNAAETGNNHAREALKTLRNIRDFALWGDLQRLGCAAHDWPGILDAMLSPDRLGIGQKPKGLLPFHAYGASPRTAVEEHCYSILALGFGKIHFSIKEDSVDALKEAAAHVQPKAGRENSLDVSYSFQSRATDTICLSNGGEIYRENSGEIVFRAGGHGSLLPNLQRVHGDIVFLRNIDNIVTEPHFALINDVRVRMATLLLNLEAEIHAALRRLADEGTIDDAVRVLTKELGLTLPAEAQPVDFYIQQLNRPIRVCGVIKTKGDVGGGVYWTKEARDISRVQIVEGAQLSYSDSAQLDIAAQLAYFNPVDIVCSVRDFQGGQFDLTQFTDPNAVIITQKSKGATSILAFEHPGLWNGGMARWNSVFVEIPASTFQPVKRFSDLLNQFHRAGA